MIMKQKAMVKRERGGERCLPALGGALLLGAVLGSFCCIRMERLCLVLQEQQMLTLWQCFWPELVLLLVVLLSGFVRIGCWTALFAMAVKGFFLSAVSTAQVLQMGSRGYLWALPGVLLPAIFSVAALLLLGRQAMGWSVMRQRYSGGRGKLLMPDSAYFITAAVCSLLILLSAIVQLRLTPMLWSLLEGLLPLAG